MKNIYLIQAIHEYPVYKIGIAKDIAKRIKTLQTSNSEKLTVINYYQSKYASKVEKSLHNHFKNKRLEGEWFELNKEDVIIFKSLCEKYEKIFDSLRNNPFIKY